MKICITSIGPNLEDMIDPRFGRCRFFIILNTESMQFEAFDNSAINASGGAGIQSAQFVADKGIEAVLTGNVGPNAFKTLNAAGLKIFVGIPSISIKQAVEEFKSGKFKEIENPSVKSKFGMGGGGAGRGMSMNAGNVNQQQSVSSLSNDEELTALKEESQKMKEGIEKIQKRIDELTENR